MSQKVKDNILKSLIYLATGSNNRNSGFYLGIYIY